MHKLFLFLSLIYTIVVVDSVNPYCNITGFAGPACRFLDCGEHGILNSARTACICNEGYSGLKCTSCSHVPSSGEQREYVCCPLSSGYDTVVSETNGVQTQWWLLAPKKKDLFRFLSGFYSVENCVRQGGQYIHSETEIYNVGCDCKLSPAIILQGKRQATEEEEQKVEVASKISLTYVAAEDSVANAKRTVATLSPPTIMELFLKDEISKRDTRTSSSYFTPANFADLLVGESGISQLRVTPSASAILNRALSRNASVCAPTMFSLAEELVIVIIGLVLGIFILFTTVMIYICCFYKKTVKNMGTFLVKMKTPENLAFAIAERKNLLAQHHNAGAMTDSSSSSNKLKKLSKKVKTTNSLFD